MSETTLASRMNTLGYATCIVGTWHLAKEPDRLPMHRGFDEYYGVVENPGSYFKPRGFIDSRVSAAPQDALELFNLANDVGETTDLADKQPDTVKELKALWDQWNTQLAPPRRDGASSKPSPGDGGDTELKQIRPAARPSRS